MRLSKFVLMVILGMSGPFALADDKNCSDLANPQARQECLQHKYGKDVDCSKLGAEQARKECLQYKGNNADCSKLATPELRRQCGKQKVN
jgi:hypothetical protein